MAGEYDTLPLVVHVAESYAGGVKVAIDDYVRNTADLYRHALIFAPRQDAPIGDANFDSFCFVRKLPPGHLARIAEVRRTARDPEVSLIHAHSSLAGVYARLSTISSRNAIVYTPHCFAFERRDIGLVKRAAFVAAEYLLSLNTAAIAACSPREAKLASIIGGRVPVVYVPNVPPTSAGLELPKVADPGRLHVVSSGRASPQKDPEFFLSAVLSARELGHDIDATWIGGDERLKAEFEPHGIEVTGWLERAEIHRVMRSATAYVHTARWEGFPLALLEVQQWGVPAIVRRIRAFEDFDFPLLVDTPSEIGGLLQDLKNPDYRARVLRQTAVKLGFNTDASQRETLRRVYQIRKT